MKKLKITDKEAVRNGADYTFVCGKIPFAITCSKILPHGENNLIDLDLINKMKIPLLNIRVRRIQILGQECRSVGTIDQTIHCVSEGKLQGTIHLSATVVRNLYENFDIDCLASFKTYHKLVGKSPPKTCQNVLEENEDEDDDTASSLDSSDEMMINKDHNDDEATKCPVKDEPAKPPDDPQPKLSVLSDEDHHKWRSTAPWGSRPADWVIAKDIARFGKCTYIEEITTLDNHSHSSPDDNSDDEDTMCDTCFYEGKPIHIATSHQTDCPTCPTMDNDKKLRLYGPNWKKLAKQIFEERHRRRKEELRRTT